MTGRTVAAVDLGAESACVAAVTLTGGLKFRLATWTPNVPRIPNGQLTWTGNPLARGFQRALAAGRGKAVKGARLRAGAHALGGVVPVPQESMASFFDRSDILERQRLLTGGPGNG